MKSLFAIVAACTAAVAFDVGTGIAGRPAHTLLLSSHRAPRTAHLPPLPRPTMHPVAHRLPSAALNQVVAQYCAACHNASDMTGNLSLDDFDIDKIVEHRDVGEMMIRKLRAQMMPPPGMPRPAGDTLLSLVETLENVIDHGAPLNAGTRPFQRLNRDEYENAVKDLLGVDINAGDYLPLDTKSANFDNIADVQALSPTLLESYLNAATAVSRLAIGDRKAGIAQTTYPVSSFISQHPWDHIDGTPYGTRGGIVADHIFPADGYYQFKVNIEGGVGIELEDVDISINGQRVALIKYERNVDKSVNSADLPLGVDQFLTEPILVKAGQQKVSAAFVRRFEGPYEDLIRPHDWSLASNGTASAGTTAPPHLLDFSIIGPQKTVGISETPSRKIIFSCRPSKTLSETACAQQIINRLGTKAYRRPLTKHDVDGLMSFYAKGAANGAGFEEGIRSALQAMLASPYFVFRIESAPQNVQAGQNYELNDYELASRLSFFLWASIPDDTLLSLAAKHQLTKPGVLEAQARRMLADPRAAQSLSTRFAGQWLRLSDIDKVRPDPFWFPDYTQQLGDDMRKETELFFADIVAKDKSVMDLYTANYTFVNDRLAEHYGIPNVSGPDFRMVQYPDSNRRGIFGQGSMLLQTSVANRTSPVLRGKWVMQVLLGSPPPPPPPNIPPLDETADGKDGHQLTTRERMEIHRRNPTCNACHQFMDPIGLSLDNFDVTGRWRYRENGVLLDTQGKLYDGTPVASPTQLLNALMKRPIPLVRTFTENLMAYAIGRRMEDFDQTSVRAIARDAERSDYKFSSFVMGVVKSPAFHMKRAEAVAADADK